MKGIFLTAHQVRNLINGINYARETLLQQNPQSTDKRKSSTELLQSRLMLEEKQQQLQEKTQ